MRPRNFHLQIPHPKSSRCQTVLLQQCNPLTLTPIHCAFDRLNAAYLSKSYILGPAVVSYQTLLDQKDRMTFNTIAVSGAQGLSCNILNG